jgi:hypothetical protein
MTWLHTLRYAYLIGLILVAAGFVYRAVSADA